MPAAYQPKPLKLVHCGMDVLNFPYEGRSIIYCNIMAGLGVLALDQIFQSILGGGFGWLRNSLLALYRGVFKKQRGLQSRTRYSG